MKSSIACAGVLLILSATGASASGGRFFGRVTNDASSPVPYKQITWGTLCPSGGPVGHSFTDVNGYWSSPVLPNGKYSVGAGPSPCAKTVYLCGSDNTKTIINDADVTGVDFTHDVEAATGTMGGGGWMNIKFGYGTDGPTTPNIMGSYNQPIPCGANPYFMFTADANHTIQQVTVDGVDQGAISSYEIRDFKANHTVTVSFLDVSTGACCQWPSLTCSVMTAQNCAQVGGYYIGGAACSPYPCGPVRARVNTWGRLKTIYR